MSTTRIGIVGTENSHAEHYIRMFNVEHRHGDAVVTALSGGDNDRNRHLAAIGAIDRVVSEPADMLEGVDAVIVCSRDGAQHREEASPFLRAGRAVLVDKPLACNLSDARALVDEAGRSGSLLTSFSALRWLPQVEELQEGNEPASVFVTGPADPDSPYGGLFFYGIHVVELALQLVGSGPVGEVTLQRVPDGLVATAAIGQRSAVMQFVHPSTRRGTYWGIVASGQERAAATGLSLAGQDYLVPGVERFVAMMRTGVVPLSQEELLAPVELMVRIVQQLPSAERT